MGAEKIRVCGGFREWASCEEEYEGRLCGGNAGMLSSEIR